MNDTRFEPNMRFSEKKSVSVDEYRQPERSKTKPKSGNWLATSLKLFILMCVLAAVGMGGYFGWNWYHNPQTQINRVVAKVGRKIELPDSMPTIATVTDKTKLANQAFFKNAENGDQILIYPDVGKAILYRPSVDKIVEVAPIQLAGEQNGLSATNSNPSNSQTQLENTSVQLEDESVKASLVSTIGLYNGTTTPGITRQAETALAEILEARIIFRDNAVKRTYTETIVVDTTGIQSAEAQQLADVLGGSVGDFPEGEATPSAEIVVYIGSDFLNRPQ